MAGNPEKRERIAKGFKLAGIIGAVIGLAALNFEVILFSAAAYGGGKVLEGKKK